MALNYKELRLLRRSWDNEPVKPSRIPFLWLLMAFLALLVLFSSCRVCYADITEAQGVACVIGEAESEGYEGMLAIAYALQHRGTTKGVYGCHAKRVLQHKYSYVTYMEASKAWEYALLNPADDNTNGATGWGNSADLVKFKRAKWWNNCVLTARVGRHFFYKQRGR